MAKIVTMNTGITEALSPYRIDKDEARLYLLGVYFGLETKSISENTKTQVNASGILERKYRGESSIPYKIEWKIPLFTEEKDEPFAWIEGYRKSFERINSDRKGTKSACTARMKKFFAEHPEVRMIDVKNATELYHRSITDPQYLKSAHKFISEGVGANKVSLLEQWLEKVAQNNNGITDGRASKVK